MRLRFIICNRPYVLDKLVMCLSLSDVYAEVDDPHKMIHIRNCLDTRLHCTNTLELAAG